MWLELAVVLLQMSSCNQSINSLVCSSSWKKQVLLSYCTIFMEAENFEHLFYKLARKVWTFFGEKIVSLSVCFYFGCCHCPYYSIIVLLINWNNHQIGNVCVCVCMGQDSFWLAKGDPLQLLRVICVVLLDYVRSTVSASRDRYDCCQGNHLVTPLCNCCSLWPLLTRSIRADTNSPSVGSLS